LLIWAVLALALAFGSDVLVRTWKLTNPASLWVTLLLGMLTLWMAVLRGLLQGRQNFLVFGWVVILDGLGRFTAVTVILLAFGGLATGAISGALLGAVGALAVAAFGARELLRGPGGGFRWGPWLRRFGPLTLGAAAIMFLQNADVIYLQSVIPAERLSEFNRGAMYVPAAQIGFALTQFTVPLALVMFPRLARSAARAEKSDALALTMKSTLALGGLAALGCTLFPKLPLQVLFFTDSSKWAAAPIVPWYVWSMLAWTLGNVLLNSLLARDCYVAIPWVILVSVGYGAALWWLKPRLLAMPAAEAFLRVVQTLGIFNLLLLLVGWWFTRTGYRGAKPEGGSSGPTV
jgi:O-antigen/teichoic acid export membrane protein